MYGDVYIYTLYMCVCIHIYLFSVSSRCRVAPHHWKDLLITQNASLSNWGGGHAEKTQLRGKNATIVIDIFWKPYSQAVDTRHFYLGPPPASLENVCIAAAPNARYVDVCHAAGCLH